MSKLTLGLSLLLLAFNVDAKELYRPASTGDKGTYYVLERSKSDDGHIKVLTSRVGKGNAYTDFTELKINCSKKQYFELAGGYADGAHDQPLAPLKDWSKNSRWTNLVPGSSKSDLVSFICR